MSEMLARRETKSTQRRRDATATLRAHGENVRELLAFEIATETYALALDAVREILKPPPVTPVPRAPRDVLGVISVRGRITTVIDLRSRLRAHTSDIDKHTRVLLVDDGDEIIGLLVDRVLQVYRLSDEEIELASVVSGDMSEYVIGIGRPHKLRHVRSERTGPGGSAVSAADILILLDHVELMRR
jgi:purine-binding chemotaxis protein CheW